MPEDLEQPIEGSERARERAVAVAYRALAARDRTVFQLRGYLEGKGVEGDALEFAVDEVTAAGYLDDERYARLFADDKRRLDHWGQERIARTLAKRGVAEDLIEVAVAVERDDELGAAVELLGTKVRPASDDKTRQKAWQLLVRRGYAPELAYEAVRVHCADAA